MSGQRPVILHRQNKCPVIRRLGSRDRSVFCCFITKVISDLIGIITTWCSKRTQGVLSVFNQVFQTNSNQKHCDVHINIVAKKYVALCAAVATCRISAMPTFPTSSGQIGPHANISPGLKATEVGSHNSKYVLRWDPRCLGENRGEIHGMFEDTNVISYVCIRN